MERAYTRSLLEAYFSSKGNEWKTKKGSVGEYIKSLGKDGLVAEFKADPNFKNVQLFMDHLNDDITAIIKGDLQNFIKPEVELSDYLTDTGNALISSIEEATKVTVDPGIKMFLIALVLLSAMLGAYGHQ
ncbi:MAG: hypothetical protein QXD02_03720 [Candidatus Parvarchaeum sp.]|nr:hypothetical protein [Candidatus Parvarchaeota archaeon]MCW1295796.1 hypothetical protein [Candidatus Parvarchaeum tengchongense]MCW1299402.1 hypothetical protein [Candidatus Parvarchaeum tengchongense]